MAPPMANNPPTLHRRRINRGSPRSRAINPVVVKIPPPMILLTRRQLAVNQPMVWYGLSDEVLFGSDARVMSGQCMLLVAKIARSRHLPFLAALAYHTCHGRGEGKKGSQYDRRTAAQEAGWILKRSF